MTLGPRFAANAVVAVTSFFKPSVPDRIDFIENDIMKNYLDSSTKRIRGEEFEPGGFVDCLRYEQI